jgi:hypothetical protein
MRRTARAALVLRGARNGLTDPDDLARHRACRRATGVLGDRPGHEIEYPLAVVIIGGLVTSAFAQSLRRSLALPALRPSPPPRLAPKQPHLRPQKGCPMVSVRRQSVLISAAIVLPLVPRYRSPRGPLRDPGKKYRQPTMRPDRVVRQPLRTVPRSTTSGCRSYQAPTPC